MDAKNGSPKELTLRAVLLGTIMTVLFGAANAYLGLRVGMTISASIPAAVISMAILRTFCRDATILENNMVQTIASSGESLAAGVIFTIPALFLIGVAPDLIKIFVISIVGGFLGIFFMIPLRRYLIVREHGKLPFPEGTACAEVLKAGAAGGKRASAVGLGLVVGAVFQFLMNGLKLWRSEGLSWAVPGIRKATVALDPTPALLGVGFIIGPRIALTMIGGGVLGWLVLIPLIDALGNVLPNWIPVGAPIDRLEPQDIWKSYIRYIGAGAVALGGLVSLLRAMPVIVGSVKLGLSGIRNGAGGTERTDRDLPLSFVLIGSIVTVIAVFILLQTAENNILLNLAIAVVVVLLGFLFVTVAAQTVGIVGSSSNPVSGMTITTLILISLLLVALGWSGTGGSVIAPALVIGWLLFPIHEQFGFGDKIAAPQATMMKTVVEGIMGENFPWILVLFGAAVALIVELFRVPSLAFAIGLYLPLGTTTPILIGALIAFFARKWAAGSWEARQDRGVLFSSGLVAGDALIGLVIVLLSTVPLGAGSLIDAIAVGPFPLSDAAQNAISATLFFVLVFGLWRFVTRDKSSPTG